ncbi:MAG: phytoene dehydrogenase [Verrucomicrobia bacterium]|nr:phytoene dehydrogenase [Verrucomicrobiota bacterium]
MTTRHYDVVVLGRSLGALTAAALLARRDFRVLLLGQGQRPCNYHFEGHLLRRRTFTLLSGTSPAWRRVLHELAQTPRFRRRVEPLDPMFAFMSPGRRVHVPPDMELFVREVDREFPEVRQLVDELYASFAQVNAAADMAFERDCAWPPDSLLERIETGRLAATLPYVRSSSQNDLLGKFPVGHPYRSLVLWPAVFAAHMAVAPEQLPPFALARLHGAWTRGIQSLSGGEDELAHFLLERIEAHGGQCRLSGRATSVVVRRGAVAGVLQDGDEEMTSTSALITDLTGELLADLAGGEGITSRARRDWPRLTAAAGRFVVSLVVRRRLLPDPLPQEAFLVGASSHRPDPRRPTIHLQRIDATAGDGLGIRDAPPRPSTAARDEASLVAEALLPVRGALTLLEAREAVLATLREYLPFINDHLLVVDSPHDGLPLRDLSSGKAHDVDRIHLAESTPGAEPMQWLWKVDPPGWHDLAGEGFRGPIPGTYLVGPTVLPGLGQEGELLAAWSAARAITHRNRARQKIRRQMWTKIETG